MTEQEIREGAPLGATHYELDGSYLYYYRVGGVVLEIWNKRKQWVVKPYEWISEIKPL